MNNERAGKFSNILILVVFFLFAWNITIAADAESLGTRGSGATVCAAEQEEKLSFTSRFYRAKDYSHLYETFGAENRQLKDRIESYRVHVEKANQLIREMNILAEAGMTDSAEYRDLIRRFEKVVKTVHLQEESFTILLSR